MLHQIAPEVNIECPVRSIPDEIEVVVTEMHIGDTITMGDLELPPSAKLLDEPDDPVASVQYISEEEEEEPEEGLEAAEPEIIGEAAAEEGEEGEAEGGEGEQE
jgi:large subunit ribosomal protein L25